MLKKFNQLKQEHGKSDADQCKWSWFESCLMIWGKTAKACGTAGGMDNGIPIDLVGGSAQEPINLEDTEEHDGPPPPGRQVLPFAGNSSQVKSVRLHPRRAQQLARSRGWTVSLHKNLFLRNCIEGN
jgi:hypothetical protein